MSLENNCYYCYWFIRSEGKCHKNIPVDDFRIAIYCKYFDEMTDKEDNPNN